MFVYKLSTGFAVYRAVPENISKVSPTAFREHGQKVSFGGTFGWWSCTPEAFNFFCPLKMAELHQVDLVRNE